MYIKHSHKFFIITLIVVFVVSFLVSFYTADKEDLFFLNFLVGPL